MTIKTLTYSITGISSGNVDSVSVNEAYNSPTVNALVKCSDTSLDLGDFIVISVGYGSNTKIFSGYVNAIRRNVPEHLIEVVAEDVLTKNTNYFIASNDPDEPLTYSNISSEDYVEDILSQAWDGDMVFEADVPLTFTWATDAEAEVNLISSWEAANEMAQLLAWHIYADRNGKIWFTDRRPYKMAGDSSEFSWDETAGTNVISLIYSKSTEETRNRVVVYGREGIYASASQINTDLYYSGYYKTAVIGHPLIQTQDQAQLTADYNLELYNRLTETLNMTVEGDPDITARKIATVTTSSFTGAGTGDWFIYQCTHNFGQRGYTVDMLLTK